MRAKVVTRLANIKEGYIAGINNGIVTVNGQPSARYIYVLDAESMELIQSAVSLTSGHYALLNLDPAKQYLVMARDHEKQYEPAVWDYVTPATDLTIAEQQELWQPWQTSP